MPNVWRTNVRAGQRCGEKLLEHAKRAEEKCRSMSNVRRKNIGACQTGGEVLSEHPNVTWGKTMSVVHTDSIYNSTQQIVIRYMPILPTENKQNIPKVPRTMQQNIDAYDTYYIHIHSENTLCECNVTLIRVNTLSL